MSNRKPGVFDPGAIGIGGAREADWNLTYCECFDEQFKALGYEVFWTRRGNAQECPILGRVRQARDVRADLLLSVHMNADAVLGNSAPDGRVKGFEVLWRTDESCVFAMDVADAMRVSHHEVRGGAIRSRNLYVLRFEPSILVEIGFIDDPEDFALITNAEWMEATCKVIVQAIHTQFQQPFTP
jgi:N-acetylmuramoyl-L-alanine amidase